MNSCGENFELASLPSVDVLKSFYPASRAQCTTSWYVAHGTFLVCGSWNYRYYPCAWRPCGVEFSDAVVDIRVWRWPGHIPGGSWFWFGPLCFAMRVGVDAVSHAVSSHSNFVTIGSCGVDNSFTLQMCLMRGGVAVVVPYVGIYHIATVWLYICLAWLHISSLRAIEQKTKTCMYTYIHTYIHTHIYIYILRMDTTLGIFHGSRGTPWVFDNRIS